MSASPTDYLAAERTVLAWIRTGLALMGFGFVVARFGLFLRALQAGHSGPPAQSFGPSYWFGTALIVLGVAVNILSAWRHIGLVRELNRGGTSFKRPSTLAVVIALSLAAVGLAMAIYLITVREPAPIHPKDVLEKPMALDPDMGIVGKRSNHSVDETIKRLSEILQARGIKLFALVDYSGEAENVGLRLRPTKFPIFGNPEAGTPLMIASSSIVIDLPLKILVWEDSGGQVWISYNSPAYLGTRHRLPHDLLQNIAVVEVLAAVAAG